MIPVILFVDDEGNVRRGIQRMLWAFEDQWQIEFVDGAKPALEYMEANPVSVVVTDHNMPGMTGLEFITQIRSRPEWKSLPVVMLTGCNDRVLKRNALEAGASDLLSKPIDQEDLVARLISLVRLKAAQDKLEQQNLSLERAIEERTRQLEQSQYEIVFRLSKAAEVHDVETGNHTLRVGFSSQLVAVTLGLPRDFQTKIVLAAPLHDIGKLGVPDRILQKEGPLTPEEREIMQQHCVVGHRMLTESFRLPRFFELESVAGEIQSSPFIEMASQIALQHHEKWDGTGYPYGKAGEEIDLAARIVAVADVYDALRTKRTYKPSFSEDESVQILRKDAGSHFDEQVVEAFLDCLPIINSITEELADPAEGNHLAA